MFRIRIALILLNFGAIRIVRSEVVVDFGHYKEPVLREDAGVTYLNNSNIIVQLRCKADYPTQWIHNFDDESRSVNGLLIQEWTDRKFSGSIDDGIYDYIAWTQLQYSKMRKPVTLLCTAVLDPADRINVALTPIESEKIVSIAQSRDESTTVVKDETIPATTDTTKCGITFLVWERVPGDSYWQCEADDKSRGAISFQECRTAMLCENAFRNIKKMDKCWKYINNKKSGIDGWTPMPGNSFSSGTALCKLKGITRAQTYFFGAPVAESGPRKLELEWDKIHPSDLTWVGGVGSQYYYTNESLNAVCHFPKYGFSFDPYGALIQDGLRIKFEKSTEKFNDNTWVVEINHKLTEEGNYTVQCFGPVWNTTEWVNKTKSFQVKRPVHPTFTKTSEILQFREGDTNKTVECKAEGDPKPEIIWENANVPSISVDGPTLRFRRLELYIDGDYKCTALNKFGDRSQKTFRIMVSAKQRDSKGGGGIGIGGIIGIISAIVILIIIILGFYVFYQKFRKLSGQIAYLTYEEVEFFRQGKQSRDRENNENNACIDYMPYNTTYDVAKDKIFVDENAVLGAGAYGTVLKGTIILENGGPIAVAFKTVPKDVDLSYFKALLSELKVLAFIGNHENIVCLIGAWTGNIKHREIYVGVELCETSLVDYLRENRSAFANLFHNSSKSFNDSECYQNIDAEFSTMDLLIWSRDIAKGMEYLASKKVIHGDLAARNVLLSNEMKAKICDFGLARQLIDYNYVKSQSCPLPWKWMAIESLNQMKFSVQSDTWAFGVTLWEIFSLGNVPYAGMTWSTEFVDKLINGLRMTSPPYANEVLYDIMKNCWNDNPKKRPPFAEIVEVVNNEVEQLVPAQQKAYINFEMRT